MSSTGPIHSAGGRPPRRGDGMPAGGGGRREGPGRIEAVGRLVGSEQPQPAVGPGSELYFYSSAAVSVPEAARRAEARQIVRRCLTSAGRFAAAVGGDRRAYEDGDGLAHFPSAARERGQSPPYGGAYLATPPAAHGARWERFYMIAIPRNLSPPSAGESAPPVTALPAASRGGRSLLGVASKACAGRRTQ
eukprot:scaffold377_cov563-Prasinococcus_capsulatus_cf.AAC.21